MADSEKKDHNRIPVNIEDEMRKSYVDYAMSVIIGRALPDVRDGLKPVHRRVLFAMEELNNAWDKSYKKSARVVGDVIGKFHPHGEVAVYDTIVRLAQEFSIRYPLIDGQGNFGSIDGDPPAAMRYTEIRMSKIAQEMMADLDKETVPFIPNYDDSLREPVVLPSALPNLLLKGSSGIAVGMATNIPPHNLSELVKGVIHLIRNPECDIEELMKLIPGPDFPTGGFICGREGIRSAYLTGRGGLQVRARATVEPGTKPDRERIVITEIPYQVNKSRMVERIAHLVNDRKVEGISDIRDESDRDGIRVVLELKRGEIAQVILNKLFKYTQMQETFGVIFLSIVDGRPRVLNLKEMLHHFIEHRRTVVTRRTQFDLRKAEAKAHILEGLKIALDNLDAVIKLIRNSKGPKEAKEGLRLRFKLSDIQAQAILDIRLQRLTSMERQKVMDEYRETLKEIARHKEILANERLLMGIITRELEEIAKKYGDKRRTEIIGATEDISIEDLIAEEEMVISCTHSGYIKRSPLSVYRRQKRGGKGRIGMVPREADVVKQMFVASTHNHLLIFTSRGRVHWLKVHEIPQVGAAGKGKALANFVHLAPGELIATLISTREFPPDKFIVMATRKGIVKKTELAAYSHPRAGGIIALTIDPGDSLLGAEITGGTHDIFMATRNGLAIRFAEKEVRPMGRTARGVRGIRLRPGDYLVDMEALGAKGMILSVSEKGFGKRTLVGGYRRQSRGGQGITNLRTNKRIGLVIGSLQVKDDDQVMIMTSHGKVIRMDVKGIRKSGRSTQGVKLIDTGKEDTVVSVAKIVEVEPVE
ncbi:MAG: DNA gyrase subunit A [Acidobacteria bacterium]|nr:DNA gyrase subunit A [Acidobacteriota bacterium]